MPASSALSSLPRLSLSLSLNRKLRIFQQASLNSVQTPPSILSLSDVGRTGRQAGTRWRHFSPSSLTPPPSSSVSNDNFVVPVITSTRSACGFLATILRTTHIVLSRISSTGLVPPSSPFATRILSETATTSTRDTTSASHKPSHTRNRPSDPPATTRLTPVAVHEHPRALAGLSSTSLLNAVAVDIYDLQPGYSLPCTTSLHPQPLTKLASSASRLQLALRRLFKPSEKSPCWLHASLCPNRVPWNFSFR
ncbi:hypothetical protein GALMADRAFT_145534 [Galerina marginata CBS 339.88]|uniref:Uncharacterized protein n=1 Tax=Galerina marginata (strain CBS 339.88) TaxID=685588 RepID=A0A067SHN2_GALM3|nr:hypothetical protein GALMADRAFT_145534 [Galerina marginata CBS 339.88]